MKLPRVAAAAFLVGAALSACATQTAATAATTADTQPEVDEQAASELREHHRHHHQGGVTQFIAMSLDTLGADESKRPQIEKLQSDLHACMEPAHDIARGLLTTFADGMAAGAIDEAKVEATIGQLNVAASGVHGCSVIALNQLHAILSPAEREALVDKVQAHWEVWRQVNHEAESGGRERGGRLADLTEELSLAPEQVEKISTALHAAHAGRAGNFDPKQAEEHVQAFATAFVGDSFDAKSLTANANGHLATQGARRMAVFYETVAPLLTPEQRTKLAEHLREHASHHPAVPAVSTK